MILNVINQFLYYRSFPKYSRNYSEIDCFIILIKSHCFARNNTNIYKISQRYQDICERIDRVISSFDWKEQVSAKILHLSKEVECDSYKERFEWKLEFYGVRGNSLKMFQSYYTNRKQIMMTELQSVGISDTAKWFRANKLKLHENKMQNIEFEMWPEQTSSAKM